MSIPPQPDQAQPALRTSRTGVLTVLRESLEPLSVAEVARRTGLHANTARFHLDGLIEQGYAERRVEERATRGRPRILYTARLDSDGPRSYRLLSHMLAGLVVALDRDGSDATEAGRAWGRQLVDDSEDGDVDVPAALDRLHALMERVGFAPETRSAGEPELHLHNCPFREVAVEQGRVVCALHQGLMEGALEQLAAPVEVASLEPFVEPRLCVARLRRA